MAGTSDSGLPALRLLSSVGPRPRELTGAVDLVTQYGLQNLYDHYCRKPLPASISDSTYLQNVVGPTELRRGDGMELGQLLDAGPTEAAKPPIKIQTFDVQVLQWAFTLKEAGVIELPVDRSLALPANTKEFFEHSRCKYDLPIMENPHRDSFPLTKPFQTDAEKGQPTICGNVKDDKEKKHRKKHKKHKHRDKDKDNKDAANDHTKGEYGDDHSKKHRKKKRKHGDVQEDGEGHKHKKKKQKHSSKVDVPGVVKNGK